MKKIYKFWADWCGPCKQLGQVLESATDINAEIIPINVDEDNEDLCGKFNIRNIPTLVMVDENDNELKRLSGMVTLEKIKKEFEV